MKKSAPIFLTIFLTLSLNCIAQLSANSTTNLDFAKARFTDAKVIDKSNEVIIGYYVEERIIMKLGSHTTIYRVPSLSMVNKNDLGPNNVRIIRPIFGKPSVKPVRQKVAAQELAAIAPPVEVTTQIESNPVIVEQPAPATIETASALTAATPTIIEPIDITAEAAAPEKKQIYAIIDIVNTYERILEKGYQSIDMLTRVANSRYFDGDLAKAAKWYTQLYALKKDQQPEFYYRYAQSLKSINQYDKAAEMMKIWESKR